MPKQSVLDIFKKRTRHPYRPRASEIIGKLFPDFDAYKTPGESLVAGSCRFLEKKLTVIAQEKPKPGDLQTSDDLRKLNYGMLTSDDHSFIMSILKKLRKQDLENTYLFTIVDTYGADISMYSAQRFQAFFIAHLIRAFLTIPIRTISLILGEGGSGGALAIQVTDIRGQMEDALYATAPPESMASIVFRDPERIEDALAILKPTAKELRNLGVIDRIVPCPEEVTNTEETAENIGQFLTKAVKDLSKAKINKLVKKREIRAKQYGLSKKSGPLHDIKRYFEKPIKKAFRKPPPDIKTVNYSTPIEVSQDYGDIGPRGEATEYVQCGAGRGGNGSGGCGKLIPLQDFLDNFNVCPDCGHEMFVAFSCKQRCTCPSCHQKQTLLTAIHVAEEVCSPVAHRQVVLTIPKRLRMHTRFDRKLLGKLCACAWTCILAEVRRDLGRQDVVPGMIGTIQTHGELLHWHPHIHALVTCGAFTSEGEFVELPEFDLARLEVAWQEAVFALYLAEEKVEPEVVENMRAWPHSGFSVDQSVLLPAGDRPGIERLVEYMTRCPFSLSRLVKLTKTGKFVKSSCPVTMDGVNFTNLRPP